MIRGYWGNLAIFMLVLPFTILHIHISSFAQALSNIETERLRLRKERILRFIYENRRDFRVVDLILLDFIQRRFNLPKEFRFEESFTRIPTDEDLQALRIYGRLVGYKNITYKKPEKAEPFTWNVINAIFVEDEKDCPDKRSIISRLKTQLIGKGYEITHTALAFGLYVESRCLDKSDPEVKELLGEICLALQHLSIAIKEPTDLKFESLCFLCYLGCKDMVDPNEVDKILEYQRDDGAYSSSLNPHSGINVHTTLLALWLICEFTSPHQTFNTPMKRE